MKQILNLQSPFTKISMLHIFELVLNVLFVSYGLGYKSVINQISRKTLHRQSK